MRQFTVFSFQFTILITTLIFLALLFLPTTHSSYAQTGGICAPLGTTPPRADGLVTSPEIVSGVNGPKFGTSSGACVVDTKATFAPYKIPTFDDLRSLYFTQKQETPTIIKHELAAGDQTQANIPAVSAFPTDSLLAYWKMDETNGSSVADSSSSHFTGTAYGTTIIDGKLSKARSFNGSSDFLNMGQVMDFNDASSAQFSISLWFKRDSGGERFQTLIDKSDSSSNYKGYALRIDSAINAINFDLFNAWTGAGNAKRVATPYNSVADTVSWHHLIVTYNGSNAKEVKIYLDGQSVQVITNTNALSGSISVPSKSMLVGASELNQINGYKLQYFKGKLDELGFWGKALTAQEAGGLYNGSRGLAFTNTDHLYHINGDLNISGNNLGTGSEVVFVEGNLNFTGNYTYAANPATGEVGASTGTVFVVKNNVNIDPAVQRIDAIIISSGTIYTAGAGCALATNPGTNSQLIINGSLISLDELRPIKFCRNVISNNNATPAEKINHQVKYLVILRDLFSDTYQKWSEIQ